jgi:hypothetical protein
VPSKAQMVSSSPANGTRAAGENTGSAVSSPQQAAGSTERSAAGSNTGKFTAAVSPRTRVASGVTIPATVNAVDDVLFGLRDGGPPGFTASLPADKRPTDAGLADPTAVTITGRDAPRRRRARISATTSSVNRVGPLGPCLPDPNAATPTSRALDMES